MARWSTRKELKYLDTQVDDATVSGPSGTIAASTVLAIAQGDTETDRRGRRVFLVKLAWEYDIQLPPTATAGSTSDLVRVILYLDQQANGSAAAVTDILEDDDYQSFNNLANSRRFVILHDKRWTLSATGGTGASASEALVHQVIYVPLGIHVDYTGTTGAIGEIAVNNIGVLLLSKSGLCVFKSKLRVRFTDD